MSFSIIAAIGQNYELGKNGGLIFHLPSDLQFFKQITAHSPLIMGLKTWKSLPAKLPGREHFILAHPNETPVPKSSKSNSPTRFAEYSPTSPALGDQSVVKIIRDLDFFLQQHDQSLEYFVIGGGFVFNQFLPLADKLYLTEIAATDPAADVFFPEFDRRLYQKTLLSAGTENHLTYQHLLYHKGDKMSSINTKNTKKSPKSPSNSPKNPQIPQEFHQKTPQINSAISTPDPVFSLIDAEFKRQSEGLELIPSENYVSPAVLKAAGSILTNKYSEGYPNFDNLTLTAKDDDIATAILPNSRYYGGQVNVDRIERLAISRAKKLFHADHANVQPHSGANANEAVYYAWCEPGDKILGMNLAHGGHLTHGAKVTRSAKIYQFINYGTTEDGDLDYAEIEKIATEEKPKIILIGYSAFMKIPDFARVAKIGHQIGALLMADMAHVAGLIAGGVHPNPIDYGFHVMTTTTHKTLRGPRGGIILSKGTVSSPLKKPEKTLENIPTLIDRAVFPGTQGGPLEHQIAAKAVAFGEALRPEFHDYTVQILKNAKALASALKQRGFHLIGGGTDNHLLLIDMEKSFGIDGKIYEIALDKVGLTLNANALPRSDAPAFRPAGVRLGTPAITTRGLKESEMTILADVMTQVAHICQTAKEIDQLDHYEADFAPIKTQIRTLALRFPLPQ